MSFSKKLRGIGQVKDTSKSSSSTSTTINHLPNEILDMIFHNLDCKELLACRLVSWRLNEMSTYKLLIRKCLRVDFPFKQVVLRARPILANNPKANSHSLEKLSQILDSPLTKSFPTSKFYFIVLTQNENDIMKFFTNHGSFIKNLELNLLGFKQNTFKTVMLLQKLLVKIPNVEYLVLNLPDEIRGNSHELCLSRNELEKLKTLNFGQYWLDQAPSQSTSRIIRGIVGNAKNIETLCSVKSLGVINYNHIPLLVPANKFHIIKKVSVDFKGDLNDDANFPVSSSLFAPKYLVIEIPFITSENTTTSQRSKINNSVENVLKNCSSDLEELKIIGSFSQLKMNKFPRFSHLHNVTINVNTLRGVFPLRFDCNMVFPNLHTLCLEIDVGGKIGWSNIFSDTRTSHNNLKELIIKGSNLSSSFNESWIENIAESFSNLTKLDIGIIVMSKKFGKSLWNNFSMLKSLRLQIIVDNPSTAVLDSVFTGISRQRAEELRRKLERDLTDEDVKNIKREHASILNLKNLINLEIGLCGALVPESPSQIPVPVLSYVTGKFAFEPLAKNKKFRARIYFPGRNFFNENDFALAWTSIEKYATVDFNASS